MRRVVTLAAPGTPLFELGIPSRLFGAARGADGELLYDVDVVAADGSRTVHTAEGLGLAVDAAPEALADADIVIVASSDRLLDPAAAQQLIGNLQAHLAVGTAVRPGLRVASICSGAFLLGAMGLLDDRDATTHWRHCDTLARRHLGARIHPEALYVDAGEVLTSAGVAAGIDLCLHIIRSDHGTRIANNVARSCIVAPLREGGQAQYIQATVTPTGGSTTAGVTAWLAEHLREPHTTASMAARAHMSTRTFERRFHAENGITPGRWLIQARVQRAKEYLEATDLPIDRIAEAVGLGSAANLRTHFHRCTGQTPHAYRRLFAPESGSINGSGRGS